MDLEFQESDLIFPDNDQTPRRHNNYFSCRPENGAAVKNGKKKKNLPVNIPADRMLQCAVETKDDYFTEDCGTGEEVVPPHVIVGRRVAAKVAFSVCSGNGRKLKGRDLSEVRNSILKMTGFLET